MSSKGSNDGNGNLQNVRVDVMTHKPRRDDNAMAYDGSREVATVARNSDFVYVNSAYVGSLNSVNEGRTDLPTGYVAARHMVSGAITYFLQDNTSNGKLSINLEPLGKYASYRVYREQYWACSKWPYGQRILAISVGLLLGTVIGMAVTMVMKLSTNDNVIAGIFKYSPD